MTQEASWGNPLSKSFERENTCLISVENCEVRVNRRIGELALEVLENIARRGVKLPRTLASGSECIAFTFPPGAVSDDYNTLGFVKRKGQLAFAGTVAEAMELTDHLIVQRVIDATPHVDHPEGAWQTAAPGDREVKLGDKGDDVLFFQMVINAPDQSGVCSLNTLSFARMYQEQYGVPVTGTIDSNVWDALLPTSLNYGVGYGDQNRMVRTLQALLLCYDWTDKVSVTGRFDQVTMGAVKEMQEVYGLYANGDVGAAEWAVLLGRGLRIV